MLALINIILTCSDLSAQPICWCKTIDAGPNFKEMYEWEDGDYLGAARYDVRNLGFGVITIAIATNWMVAVLNDRGLRGDPAEADSIFWHWEKVPFGDFIYRSIVTFTVLNDDSTWLTENHPNKLFPNIRSIPDEMTPNDGTIVTRDSIDFNWHAVDGVDYYAFYIWDQQPDIENFSTGLCYYSDHFIVYT